MKIKFKYIPFFLFTSIFASCQTPNGEITTEQKDSSRIKEIQINPIETNADTTFFNFSWIKQYNYKNALINVIDVPKGYKREVSDNNSFSNWLRHLPINDTTNKVYLYNGEEKYNQNAQYKVIDIDVGNADLQQCADAVMRLRAEYLYTTKQYNKIHFNYTNGTNISFTKWSSGFYPSIKGNKVVWTAASNNKSYESFKKYMKNIFMYAGTSSLEKELNSIELSEIQSGDVFIKGGFPGHAVIVLDVAINEKTKDKCFMIAQSYMPAQSIHILKNPNNANLSPWYNLKEIEKVISTPEWTFYSNQLKRFKE